MKTSITTIIIALAIVISATFWWIERTTRGREQTATDTTTGQASSNRNTRIQPADPNKNNFEFTRLKVDLPPPINKPWRASVINSKNCHDPERKGMATEVLPGWIRKALLSGNREMAARYLWSLQTLANDEDARVSSEAVLAIYKLGDTENFARNRIIKWIKDGWNFKTYDLSFGSSEYLDIRERVLRELIFSNDYRFDDLIFSEWKKNSTSESKEMAAVDYAYYLHKRGRELPDEYWVQRLSNPYGFENALEVSEEIGTPEVTAKLQVIFEKASAMPPSSLDFRRAATVAATLFRQTGEVRYRDYLMDQARTRLASENFETSLAKILDGLASSNDKAALEIVSNAMQHKNEMVHESAIYALGRSQDPSAAEILFDSAMQKAKAGTTFPSREMRALLMQDNADSDAKYQQLQQALLSGQLGWTAATSDFDRLEFFRKHGRR